MTLLLKHLHVFRELLFRLIPGWVNNTACKHNDESVTHSSPWHHTGRNAEGGHLMSLLLIAAYDGATRWQWRDTTVPHCSVVQPSVLKAVTQRQKWGLGQDASCYFHSLALSLSPPLCWGTARNNHRLTETWRIRSFFSSLSHSLLSARKACRQRERAWQNRSTFSFHHCSLPVGWKPVLSPAYFSLLQSELQWSELTWLLEWQQWGRKWWYNRLSVLKLSESLE